MLGALVADLTMGCQALTPGHAGENHNRGTALKGSSWEHERRRDKAF